MKWFSTSSADTCSLCPAGSVPNSGHTSCWSGWGNGLRTGSEEWDDNNSSSGDGCSSNCTIEDGYIWSGGPITARDAWSLCPAGKYQNYYKSLCVTRCGDGLRVTPEVCDNQNTVNGDGWSSDWLSIETNYFCIGGTWSSKDVCTLWNNGYYFNNSSFPTACVTIWGEGFLVGTEQWDDENAVNGDGWSSTCTIETNKKWVCHGGTSTSYDNCEVCGNGFNVNDNTNPRYCTSVCDDWLRVGSEVWDTGGLSNSPWMKGWATILVGFVCTEDDSSGADHWSAWPNSLSTNYDQSSWEVKPATYSIGIFRFN